MGGLIVRPPPYSLRGASFCEVDIVILTYAVPNRQRVRAAHDAEVGHLHSSCCRHAQGPLVRSCAHQNRRQSPQVRPMEGFDADFGTLTRIVELQMRLRKVSKRVQCGQHQDL